MAAFTTIRIVGSALTLPDGTILMAGYTGPVQDSWDRDAIAAAVAAGQAELLEMTTPDARPQRPASRRRSALS